MLLLLACVMGGYGVYAYVSLWFACRHTAVDMEIPIQISEKEQENMVRIKVNNEMRSSIGKADVLINVREITSGKIRKYRRKLPCICEGESTFVESLIFGEMGKYEVTLKGIRIYDLSGCICVRKKCNSTVSVRVMPGMYEVPVYRTEATRMYLGETDIYDEKRSGLDHSEVFQIREYRKGDRMQNVHWKLTARHDELVVKEHSLPKPCPVVLYLDFALGFKKGNEGKRIAFLEAAAGISYSVMKAGCPHYITWYDQREKDVLRIRVDDEESMFYLIATITEMQIDNCEGGLLAQYRDKYREESYIREYVLTDELVVRCNDEELGRLSAKELETSMAEIELIL